MAREICKIMYPIAATTASAMVCHAPSGSPNQKRTHDTAASVPTRAANSSVVRSVTRLAPVVGIRQPTDRTIVGVVQTPAALRGLQDGVRL